MTDTMKKEEHQHTHHAHGHHHEHGHGHHHGHGHGHAHAVSSINGIMIAAIVLNLLFVGIEAAIGWWQSSLSLLSDAGHNLSDVFSLLLALVAFRLVKIRSNLHYTYGYKKSSILISMFNAILLLIVVGAIVAESIHKFSEPVAINGSAVAWTAGAGIIVNGLTALMLMRGQKSDLNVRGAFLHMVADTLVSVGVLVSGILIHYTGWSIIDPIVSLIVAAVILASTWGLLSASLRLSLDGMPEGISLEQVNEVLRRNAHVTSAHHIHVWAISTTENALTAHIVIDDIGAMEEVKKSLKQDLATVGITHSTLEMEPPGSHCCEQECHSGC